MYASARSIVRRLVHNDLPMGAARLFFSLLLFVISIVVGAYCVKIWTKHNSAQKHLRQNLPSGVSASLKYGDIRTTAILLFLANNLVTFLASNIAMIIVQDIFKIIPSSLLRRFKIALPDSTATLPHQAVAMLVSTTCFIVAAAFHTDFVFNRSGAVDVHQGGAALPTSAIQATLDRLGIVLRYRDVSYIRVSAEMPWLAVFFAVGATVATYVGWYKSRRAPPTPPAAEESATESVEVVEVVEVEKSSELGEKHDV
ncbi:hypothetical protein C8F04DRAFT_1253472 [Mycena alexandri]|uniref:Uncharacterized protein n=1 Tax=Mycena alexandri TaxID=1745969 RepID=A0AAD6T6X7_9AGAR|nr:hypothetical protein C8F04DRAFT_1253472 [Mycena alexandri]